MWLGHMKSEAILAFPVKKTSLCCFLKWQNPPMFGFFKKKKDPLPLVDFSVIGTDMHSHFIPSIDDGSDSVATSIALIKGLMALGYKNIITTPHVMSDHYPNSSADILNGLEAVRKGLITEGVNVKVHAAAEYYLDEYFLDLLEKQPL